MCRDGLLRNLRLAIASGIVLNSVTILAGMRDAGTIAQFCQDYF
jgi:hypothetical protein